MRDRSTRGASSSGCQLSCNECLHSPISGIQSLYHHQEHVAWRADRAGAYVAVLPSALRVPNPRTEATRGASIN
jgi:hypothetical protein